MSRQEFLNRLLEPLGLLPLLKSLYAKQAPSVADAASDTSSNKLKEYEYKSLHKHDIRILELNKIVPAACPGKPQDKSDDTPVTIHATLEHISLHEDPDFVALSYTWGTLDADHSLCIGTTQLNITKNLHEALVHLYKANITRLWIDAVCINQANQDEKGRQILRLSTIFRTASDVIAWIGTHDQYTSLLFRCIENQSIKGIISGSHADVNTQLRTAFTELARRPYWGRVWVVQEFAVARQIRIMCGESIVNYRLVREMIDVYVSSGIKDVSAKEPILALTKIRKWQQDDVNIKLLDLLRCTISLHEHCMNRRVCRVFKSTDILDQIYGLLGLASDGVRFVPEPSYDFNMNELFMYMTKSIVASSGRLDFAFLEGGEDISTAQDCGSTNKRSYNPGKLPSWCPDYLNLLDSPRNSELTYSLKFDTEESPANLYAFRSRHRQPKLCWNATSNSRLAQGEYTLHNSGYMLIPGIFVGRITPCSEWEERFTSMLSTRRNNSSPFAWLDELLSSYSNFTCPSPNMQEILRGLSYLLGDATDGGINCCRHLRENARRRFITNRLPYDLAGNITDLLMKEPTSAAMLSTVPSEEVHRQAHDLGDSINYNYNYFHRKVAAFDTSESIEQVVRVAEEHGAYGWVPATACPGDEIWLLKGCSMPIVLRRPFQICGADAGVILKVGPAVINGAMNGDMWSDTELDSVKIVKC